MTQDIIRSAAEIAGASMAQLVATYNAMTGKAIKKFENRTVAERRVEMALLSATDAAGHAGVPHNAKPAPMTLAELSAKAPAVAVAQALAHEGEESGQKAANNEPGDAPGPDDLDLNDPKFVDDAVNPFQPGTMSHQLWVATKAMEPIKPRAEEPSSKKAERTPRTVIEAVKATFAGSSKTQEGSVRHSVLKFIQDAKDAHGNSRAVTLDELDTHIGASSRGYVQKLLEKKHIAIFVPEEK